MQAISIEKARTIMARGTDITLRLVGDSDRTTAEEWLDDPQSGSYVILSARPGGAGTETQVYRVMTRGEHYLTTVRAAGKQGASLLDDIRDARRRGDTATERAARATLDDVILGWEGGRPRYTDRDVTTIVSDLA